MGRRDDAPGDDLAEHDASPQARMNGHAIVVEAATGIAHDPLWYRLRKRTHDQVDDAVADDHTLHDRSRRARVNQRSGRRDDLNRTFTAFVAGYARAGKAPDRKRVVLGKRGAGRVGLGGRRYVTKKNK